jgi:hypothetical protein
MPLMLGVIPTLFGYNNYTPAQASHPRCVL